MIAASAIAIFLIPVAYAIEHLFSAWKSAREQEVAERPLGSAIAAQRELASVYLDNIHKPVLVIALALVATGCAHLADVTTTEPGVPRLMVEEEQLQSATEHLARAKHEQPSLSLGDDLSAQQLFVRPFCAQQHHLADAASFAHCQNFSAAGLRRPVSAAMPTENGFGSGVRCKNFTRFPKL